MRERNGWRRDLLYVCYNTWVSTTHFVYFGAYTRFFIGGEKIKALCVEVSKTFDRLQDTTLAGRSGKCSNGPYHHGTHIVALQLSLLTPLSIHKPFLSIADS